MQAIAGAGVISLPWPRAEAGQVSAPAKRFAASDRVTLGKTGIVTSRLALGSGTNGIGGSSKQTRMGVEKFGSIIRHGFEQDIVFWEAADQYGSHKCFRHALKDIPREKVVILTKSTSRDPGGMQKDIERFRKELETDYIDILLFHCLFAGNWPEKMGPTMEVISEAREKGILRSFGISCHTLEALKAAAADPWTEVILARLNHAGVSMDAEPEKVVPVLAEAHKNGKSVLGMKLIGVGRIKDQIDRSLQFVLGQGFVDAFTIGFESTGELDQMIGKIAAVRV